VYKNDAVIILVPVVMLLKWTGEWPVWSVYLIPFVFKTLSFAACFNKSDLRFFVRYYCNS